MTPDDRILKAKTRLMFDHPFFGVLITQLVLIDATDDPRITTMATDGDRLFFHGPFVSKLKPAELVFVLAHEVMHNAFDHHTRKGNREHRRFNRAADYAINGELVECKVGTMPECGLIDDRFTGLGAEEIYRLLEEDDGGAGGSGDPGGCGEILQAAEAHEIEKLDRIRATTQLRVRQAVAIAKAKNAGVLPAGIDRIAGLLLGAKVDWRAVLRRFVDESMTRNYSWSRPNKRMLPHGFVFPSLVADGLNHLVIAVDTSGSIDQEILNAFASEIDGAFSEGVDKLTIVYADADVQRVDELEAGDVLKLTPAGGGGTAFSKTFEWIAANAPGASCIIYLTDLYVSDFGVEPTSPVLWAVWGDRRQYPKLADKVPFGEPIHISP